MSDALDDQVGIFDVKIMAPAGRLPQRAIRRDPLQIGLELLGYLLELQGDIFGQTRVEAEA